MARYQPLDPRLPPWTLRNWPERLTKRLDELLRSMAEQLNQRLGFGQRTIYVPARAMVARTTTGAATGTLELGNKVMLASYDFDPASTEFAQFSIQMPRSWDVLTVRAKFLWAHETATASTSASCGVTWQLQALAFSDTDALGSATFSTAATVSDIGVNPLTLYSSALTASYTIENSPATYDWIVFQVSRKHDDTGDTFADKDAKLLGVTLIYSQTEMTDLQ